MARRLALTLTAAVLLAAPAAAQAPPPDLAVTARSVAPAEAYFAGPAVRIAFQFDAPGPVDLRVQIVRRGSGKVVRAFVLRKAVPRKTHRIRWNGLTTRHNAAPDADYLVRLVPPRAPRLPLGEFSFHGHKYPIRGPHFRRGGIDYFGAPRSGGRIHEGFDVGAPCGTPVAAARGGTVKRSFYDPVLYGHIVIIRGARSHRDYWYSHLSHRASVRAGDKVRTGQRFGRIGDTGNARGLGCHLHFEIRSRGRPIDPEPELRAWDRWS
jgi:murein DD-endopeptidase MepM/ murein hydrolase activator NlpD